MIIIDEVYPSDHVFELLNTSSHVYKYSEVQNKSLLCFEFWMLLHSTMNSRDHRKKQLLMI